MAWGGSLSRWSPLKNWLRHLGMKKLVEWFRPRRHRWHLVLVFAAATGLILLLPELLSEGIHPDLGRFLPVLAVFVGLGAAGVLLGYFLLGEYLGIY